MKSEIINTDSFSRECSLKASFDTFWSNLLGAGSYFDKMSISDFVELKKAISDINNIITLKVTQSFIQMLSEHGVLNKEEKTSALRDIDRINANEWLRR